MMATLEERDPAAKLVVPDTPAARRTSPGNPTGCSGHYQGGISEHRQMARPRPLAPRSMTRFGKGCAE